MKSAGRAVGAPLLLTRRARAATVVRQPYLQNVRPNSASILWTTVENGRGAIRFSRDQSLDRSSSGLSLEQRPEDTELSSSYYLHQVELGGLEPGTRYFYRVLQDGINLTPNQQLSFETPGRGEFRFLAFGDSGSGSQEQRTLAALMAEEKTSLVLHLGDLAYPRGAFAEYQAHYFDIYQDIMKRLPFFPCPGNHGYMTREAYPYVSVHAVPTPQMASEREQGRYYSFDWNNVHFVSLDTNAPLVRSVNGTSPMLEWLDQDLAAATKFWRIVFFHHPPYAGGPNETDNLSIFARRYVVPILERHNVQLVLSGHEHSYQRSFPIRNGNMVAPNQGTVYLTSGGGGMYLYPVHPHPLVEFGRSVHNYLRVSVEGVRLRVETIGLSGNVIDRAELAPPPAPSETSIRSVAVETPSVAPGGLFSILGRNMAAEESQTAPAPYPETLQSVTVRVNGQPAPVLYASATQINAQMPYGVSGAVSVEVRTPNGSFQSTAYLQPTAPGILAATRDDGEAISTLKPVLRGQRMRILAAGLGEVEGSIAAGQPAPANPPLSARAAVKVEFAGRTMEPELTVLAPGMAGVYFVQFRVPADARAGISPLTITSGGLRSNITWVLIEA